MTHGIPSKVELVPWDFTSPAHRERLLKQRMACGWRWDEVDAWAEKGEKGTKVLYWIVLSDDLEGRDELLAKHLARYPEETEPIQDTSASAWGVPRKPEVNEPQAPFVPVGHVAIDLRPEENARVGLVPAAEGGPIVWLASLYVSYALQGQGLGRSAMRAAEALMVLPPLGAAVVALDTMPEEEQLGEELKQAYISNGLTVPTISNEAWYIRQGYQLFSRETASYMWSDPQTGQVRPVSQIYLKKSLH